jgi:RNA polymerase sigma-70 factor, ECF subfamily
MTESVTANVTNAINEFEPHRNVLRALAYRMLGSRAEAEDVVQDAWLRWHAADRASVGHPRAFLSRTVTRLCLDRLKSAQAQREVYVGAWLPEPLVDDGASFQPGPEVLHEMASDLSFAFMLTLERLSPSERAAFLLHDVFDMDFGDISSILGKSEAACRQLASRARANVRAERPAVKVTPAEEARLAMAFAGAIRHGDVASLARVLAEDAVFISDGGGLVNAVPRPVHGNVKVAQVLIGFARFYSLDEHRMRPARINGLPGAVISTISGEIIQTIALEPGDGGVIKAIYVMRNPEKLRLVSP